MKKNILMIFLVNVTIGVLIKIVSFNFTNIYIIICQFKRLHRKSKFKD